MSRKCELTGKKTSSGQNRPFSLKATKRTFKPNLFTKRVLNPLTGKMERMKLSAKAIRTLKKWANQGAKAADEKIEVAAKSEKKKVEKVKKLTPKQKKEAAAAVEAAAKNAAAPKAEKEVEEASASE